MADNLQAISGKDLVILLKRNGWEEVRRTRHGISLYKIVGNEKRVTVVPTKPGSFPQGTLKAILS